jgi:hypothetical protein
MRRKLHLHGSDVKHSHHVLLESISKNVQILGGFVAAIVNAGNADGVTVIISAGVQNHVQGVNSESGTADGNAVGGGSSIAIDDVGTLIIAVNGGWGEGGVDCVGDRGGVVVEGCAGVDLLVFSIVLAMLGMTGGLQCTEYYLQSPKLRHRSG